MVTSKLKWLRVAFFATLFVSCGSDVPTKQELTGQWQDEHGGSLLLKPDGTFAGTKLSVNELAEVVSIPINLQNRAVSSFRGNWRLICDYDHCNVVLLIRRSGSESDTYSVPFIARGEGLLNAGKIERLERWLDPDGLDVYELKRVDVAK